MAIRRRKVAAAVTKAKASERRSSPRPGDTPPDGMSKENGGVAPSEVGGGGTSASTLHRRLAAGLVVLLGLRLAHERGYHRRVLRLFRGTFSPADSGDRTSVALSAIEAAGRDAADASDGAVAAEAGRARGGDRFASAGSGPPPLPPDFDEGRRAERDARRRADAFLSWFVDMGGTLSGAVTLGHFPEFGGFGLMAAENISKSENGAGPAVGRLDEMFTVPASVIVGADSIAGAYGRRVGPGFRDRLLSAVRRSFPPPLVQQDAVIALHLMAECSLGKESLFHPYLDVLPKDVTRLDTFSEEELAELQDEQLARLARESAGMMRAGWERGGMRELSNEMASAAAESSGIALRRFTASGCLTYESFHHFVAIVSSRAMVLRGVKFLAPLADMANYAPRNDGRERGMGESFTLYHNHNPDGSMTVRADRAVAPGEQIFEDYGDTDNSLFLEAHGFVPDENPFHCAMVPPEYVPSPALLPEGLVEAMVRLGILPKVTKDDADVGPPDLCVMADKSIVDKRASAYLSAAALAGDAAQQALCMDALQTEDMELISYHCIRYPGHRNAKRKMLRRIVRRALCHAPTSLQEDWLSLGEAAAEAGRGAAWGKVMGTGAPVASGSHGLERYLIALKFRIVEKRTLAQVGEVSNRGDCSSAKLDNDDLDDAAADGTGTGDAQLNAVQVEMSDELSSSLDDFNAFLDTLSFPVNKIRAQFIGDGLRLGAVAADNIDQEEVYLSIGDQSTINIDTANSDDPSLQEVLNRYRSANDDGGFKTMLLYLLHERFAAGERSRWWPYLRLLPAVEDMKCTVPLFFDEDRLDYLSGSDVRQEVLNYRRRATDLISDLASDYQVVSAVGADAVMDRDKFLWAHAILDGRSIWWDWKRHLVPLLDLVNCGELYDSDGNGNRVHRTASDESGNAATRASVPFHKGEQILENYGQPNYVYFLYHGFSLGENNTHDCALWADLSIEQTDKGSQDMNLVKSRLARNGISSETPTFCIADGHSLHSVADFLRIKLGLPGDQAGLGPDINDQVREHLQSRLHRYDKMGTMFRAIKSLPTAERTMVNLVQNERRHFAKALEDLKQEYYTSESM